MTPTLIILLVIVALVVLIALFAWMTYNSLVRYKLQADESWSGITVQLKRRADLIPNLVETVKGYAAHESGVFEKVTEARANVVNATGVKDSAAAEGELQGALKSLFAVAENYPQLKANENFMQLQAEVTDTEDKIQAARRFYNAAVRELNTRIQMFPNNVFAGMFGFKSREFFEVEDQAAIEQPVEVKF